MYRLKVTFVLPNAKHVVYMLEYNHSKAFFYYAVILLA